MASNATQSHWYAIADTSRINSPGLIVYPERIKQNIAAMLSVAGNVNRLWPHVKTHKMPEVIRLQMAQGITRFKCATLGEALMLAHCGVTHILLAIQPTREKLKSFLAFQKKFPEIQCSTLVDNPRSLALFEKETATAGTHLKLWVDLNLGMHRTGITPGPEAAALYLAIEKSAVLSALGLHAYDGHIRSPELHERITTCNAAFEAVEALKKTIESQGGTVPYSIAGGSPTFLPHALRDEVLLSPGTTLLWDAGYARIWKESPFVQAAVLATRVISKPAPDILCFDLGHKAIAPEMPLPRAILMGLEDAEHRGQSEEHLIVYTPKANQYEVGDLVYAIPYHICPTVVKYNKVHTAVQGKITGFWKVEARDYVIDF